MAFSGCHLALDEVLDLFGGCLAGEGGLQVGVSFVVEVLEVALDCAGFACACWSEEKDVLVVGHALSKEVSIS